MKTIKRSSSARWFYRANGDPAIVLNKQTLLKHARLNAATPLTDRVATGSAELAAAAHALCFSLALAKELAACSSPSGRVNTTASLTLESWAAGWTVTNVHLEIVARLPKMTQCDFIEAAVRAKTGCFMTRLFKANISMNARLQN